MEALKCWNTFCTDWLTVSSVERAFWRAKQALVKDTWTWFAEHESYLFYLLSYIASNKLEASIYPIPCQPCQQSCNLDCIWSVSSWTWSTVYCRLLMFVVLQWGPASVELHSGRWQEQGGLFWSCIVDPFHLVSNELRCSHTKDAHGRNVAYVFERIFIECSFFVWQIRNPIETSGVYADRFQFPSPLKIPFPIEYAYIFQHISTYFQHSHIHKSHNVDSGFSCLRAASLQRWIQWLLVRCMAA